MGLYIFGSEYDSGKMIDDIWQGMSYGRRNLAGVRGDLAYVWAVKMYMKRYLAGNVI